MTRLEPSELLDDGSEDSQLRRRTVLTAIGLMGFTNVGLDVRSDRFPLRAQRSVASNRTGRQTDNGEWKPVAKLTSDDLSSGDFFGWSVALDGDHALIGARSVSDNADSTGAAYVFEIDDQTGSWTQVQKITASDAGRGDLFGWSVALDGTQAIVGAPRFRQSGGGAAYVFQRREDGSWSETEDWKLVASDSSDDNGFGISVALDGPRALIGAAQDSEKAQRAGAVYAYVRHDDGSWSTTENQKLTASDASRYLEFGISLAIDGSIALVGSGQGSGETSAAYRFSQREDGSWTEDWTLADPDISPKGFGISVAIDGDSAVVGDIGDSEMADTAGTAYFFFGNESRKKLIASDAAPGDRFGISVSLDGNRALVGQAGDDDNIDVAGSAYIFDVTANQRTEQQQLTVPGIAPEDKYGWSVALDRSRALVGAFADNEMAPFAGAVHVFSSISEETPTSTTRTTEEPSPPSGTESSPTTSLPTDETPGTPTPKVLKQGVSLLQIVAAGVLGSIGGFVIGIENDKRISNAIAILALLFGSGGVLRLLQGNQGSDIAVLVISVVVGIFAGIILGMVFGNWGEENE